VQEAVHPAGPPPGRALTPGCLLLLTSGPPLQLRVLTTPPRGGPCLTGLDFDLDQAQEAGQKAEQMTSAAFVPLDPVVLGPDHYVVLATRSVQVTSVAVPAVPAAPCCSLGQQLPLPPLELLLGHSGKELRVPL
jgi:hypothetical protein